MEDNNVQLEQYGGSTYADHLREILKLIDVKSIELRQAYIYGKENRESHFQLISLLCQAWMALFPKVMNKPDLARNFKKWMKVVDDPRLLLLPRYEGLVWLFEMHIRLGYEHLNLTSIE